MRAKRSHDLTLFVRHLKIASCVLAVSFHWVDAAEIRFSPGLPNGRPGVALQASWGTSPRQSPTPFSYTSTELSLFETGAYWLAGLGAWIYLAERTGGMNGFRSDMTMTAGSFVAVGALTAFNRKGRVIDHIGVGFSAAMITSLAEYERAFHFKQGLSPLGWSAVQAGSLSIYENLLNGRRLYSRFGMDIGPGYFSISLPNSLGLEEMDFSYKMRITSTYGALLYLSRGYKFRTSESLRTGSLVFEADEYPGNDNDGSPYAGLAFGNTYAVYKPPRLTSPAAAHCYNDVAYDWAVPAHEKAHTIQLQKLDVILHPLNSLADDPDRSWYEVTHWFRPAGEIGVWGLNSAQYKTSHDNRVLERGPTSLGDEILRRAGCL